MLFSILFKFYSILFYFIYLLYFIFLCLVCSYSCPANMVPLRFTQQIFSFSFFCRVKHDCRAKRNVKLTVIKRKHHPNLMVPAYYSRTCGMSRRGGAEGQWGSRLRFTCESDELYVLVRLDTVTSLCTNGALYKRDPPGCLPPKLPPISPAHTRARTCTSPPTEAPLHRHDPSLRDCLLGRRGEGRGRGPGQRRQALLR